MQMFIYGIGFWSRILGWIFILHSLFKKSFPRLNLFDSYKFLFKKI
jgi:hypothetical protein